MNKLVQLFNKNGDKVDAINHNYEKRISKLENKKEIYSFDEIKTNEIFVDVNGKEWPVYKKSYQQQVSFTYAEGNYTYGWINSGIENFGEIIAATGSINLASRRDVLGNNFTVAYVNQNRLQFGIPASFGSPSGKISLTLKYTKIND